MLRDTQAAIDAVKDVGPVGIIGFCLGGSVAYAAATKLSGLRPRSAITAAPSFASPTTSRKCRPNCISARRTPAFRSTDVETIKAKRPDVEVHVYPGAQHGFHCDERASYDKASADIAWPRSMAFLRQAFEEIDDRLVRRFRGGRGADLDAQLRIGNRDPGFVARSRPE